MKPLFFLYVWLNLTRIAGLRKENLVKHIKKRTIQTGRLFFLSSLMILRSRRVGVSRMLLLVAKILRINRKRFIKTFVCRLSERK